MVTGSFTGLNLSLRALYSSRKALNITGENVANANTEGYTRRVAEFKTFGQNAAGVSEPVFGLGADCVTATRMRDTYLDTKIWNQSSISSGWETKNDYYTEIEKILNESSISDLTGVLDEFYSAWDQYANNPSSTTYRYLVQNRGLQLTTFFNETSTQLEELQVELNNDVVKKVDEVNDLAKQISSLNAQIYNSEILGGEASTLRDERTLLINRLSELGNVEYIEQEYGELTNGSLDKKVTIKFGGTAIVTHDRYEQLKVNKRVEKKNEEDIDGLYDISWDDGTRGDLASGELKSTIEIRDGTGQSDDGWVKGVPYYIGQLNDIARKFALAFNEGIVNGERKGQGHAGGFTFNSDVDATEAEGIRFFSVSGLSSEELINVNTTDDEIISAYNEITAKNIGLSTDILNDIGNMFRSFTDPTNNNDTDGIDSLLDFTDDKTMFGSYNLEDCVSGLITTLGVDAEIAKNLNESHDSIMTQYENQRDAYSAVSLDEEATNLIRYQEMYNAAAKVMSVFSELYDTLVSMV